MSLAWGACLGYHRLVECFLFLDFLYFSLLPPEGLKKVRNPDRMYRSAVCYAGHGPPKSISDDTETNSKSQLLILYRRFQGATRWPIYYSFIDSFIYLLISSDPHAASPTPSPTPSPPAKHHHLPPPAFTPPRPPLQHTTPPPAVLLIEVSALRDHAVNS